MVERDLKLLEKSEEDITYVMFRQRKALNLSVKQRKRDLTLPAKPDLII